MAFWTAKNPGAVRVARAAELASKGAANATAFVCEGFTCREPTSDPVRLRQQMEASRETRAKEPASFDISGLFGGKGK